MKNNLELPLSLRHSTFQSAHLCVRKQCHQSRGAQVNPRPSFPTSVQDQIPVIPTSQVSVRSYPLPPSPPSIHPYHHCASKIKFPCLQICTLPNPFSTQQGSKQSVNNMESDMTSLLNPSALGFYCFCNKVPQT